MTKGIVRAGFMAGATFYSDNADTPPYLKKGDSGRKFPLNRDTVASIEVANARGRREKISSAAHGTSESIARMMSKKGYIMVFVALQSGASFMGEIDQGMFHGLQVHAVDWGTEGVVEPENIVKTYINEIENMKRKEIKRKYREKKRGSDTESGSKIPEVRAKYGPGYDNAIRAIKAAALCLFAGWILLGATEKFVPLGTILVLLGLFLSIYSLIRLCWGRYKTSKE